MTFKPEFVTSDTSISSRDAEVTIEAEYEEISEEPGPEELISIRVQSSGNEGNLVLRRKDLPKLKKELEEVT